MASSTARRKAAGTSALPIIGWREGVALPSLGISRVKVKVDTGARTSALHVTRLKVRQSDDGLLATFDVHPVQRSASPSYRVSAQVIDQRDVRNSGGSSERRVVVRLPVVLGQHVFHAEVTLTRRERMGFRMLLGREAMRGRFLVDPHASFLHDDPRPVEPPANGQGPAPVSDPPPEES